MMRDKLLGWSLMIYAVLCLSSMAVMNLAAGLVLGALLDRMLRRRGRSGRFAREWRLKTGRAYIVLSVVLTLACALSLVVGILDPLSFNGRFAEIRFFADLSKVWYLFWPLVLVVAFRELTEQERGRALRAWLYAFAALSLIGIAQFVTGWPRPQQIPGFEPYYHVTLFLGHHLSVASILIFPFFAALDFARDSAGSGHRRSFWIAFVILGALALFGTFSRMLWGALPVGILLWIVLSLRGKLRWALVLSAVLAGFAVYQLEPVRARVQAGMGIQERFQLWEANLTFFRNRPITGVGWRNTEELSAYYFAEKHPEKNDFFIGHAHNNLLEMLGGTGAFGTLAWLAWSLGIFWLTWTAIGLKPAGYPNFARGLFCAWVVFHLNGLTQVNFWEGKVMHQMAWVIAWTLLWHGSTKREEGLQPLRS